MNDQKIVRVRDVMNSPPQLIDGLASVLQAVEKMRQLGVNSLVIEKRDEDDEYALVSVHDVAEKVVARDRSLERTSVYEIMSKPVLTVEAKMNVKYAIRLLCRFRLSRALVLEKGKLAGVVTLRDLAVRKVGASAQNNG